MTHKILSFGIKLGTNKHTFFISLLHRVLCVYARPRTPTLIPCGLELPSLVSIESCTSGVQHKIREGRERDCVYKQRKEGNNGDVRYEEKQLEDIDEVRQVEGRL